MDEQYIKANDIIGRYLLHQLSDREQYEFEEYYFEHPEIMEELEIARAMRDGLRSEPVRKVLEAAMASGRSTERAPQPDRPILPYAARDGQPSWRVRLLGLIVTPQWALSATAAAAVLAALLIVQPRARPGGPLPVVAQLELARTRGQLESESAEISISGDGVVALTVDSAGLDANTLRGTIRSGNRAVTDLPLRPEPDHGWAMVVIPTSSLPRGDYVLELHDGRGEQLSYAFKVVQ
jgi:hypothetical protein